MAASASPFLVHPAPPVAPPALVERFQRVVTPHLSDNLNRLSGIVGLTRFNPKRKLLGTAVTVKSRPGDNLGIYKALTLMQPGHVLVVDGAGDLANAVVGELLMQYAQQRGCAGFVIDGAVRDVAAFAAADFPCYARGVSHRGPYKTGPASINVPVSIAGQVVHPGDILVGDEDGIVSFPVSDAPRLLDAAALSASKEAAVQQEIANGSVSQSWLDAVLDAHGLAGEVAR
jgi:RraA family protein